MAAVLSQLPNPMSNSARRALVVDDHDVVVEAMTTALGELNVFRVVDKARTFAEASRILELNAECELVVLDLDLPDSHGRETLEALRQRYPGVPVFVFSGHEDVETITMAFECGARGYATKTMPLGAVINAIRLVLSGSPYLPVQAAQIISSTLTQMPGSREAAPSRLPLSGRQKQVLELLLQGMPNKVIGARLSMGEGTVKAHLNVVFRVLNVSNRVQAVIRARQLGL